VRAWGTSCSHKKRQNPAVMPAFNRVLMDS
jgi:hypothetical protein